MPATITHVPFRRKRETRLYVGGLVLPRNELVRWKKALLRLGDAVRLKVVEAEAVDKPLVRVAREFGSEAEAEKHHLRKLARNLDGRFGNVADLSEPILSAICMVLVIILVIERPASAKWKSQIKHDGALAVYRATRPSDPAPVRNERQGAKICAIEIILRRIRNGTKPSV